MAENKKTCQDILSGFCGGGKDKCDPHYTLENGKLDIRGIGVVDAGSFQGIKEITSVVVHKGITGIGHAAFAGCENLVSVELPESVTVIKDDAFYGCESLTSIKIPDGVTVVERCTFGQCTSLANVVLPKHLTKIESTAFDGCVSLENITIPDKTAEIERWAFLNCSGLTSVFIPKSVLRIGNAPFVGCENLKSIEVASESTFFKSVDNEILLSTLIYDSVIQCIGSKQGEYKIPQCRAIGREAFYQCNNITSVIVPEGVEFIMDWAFCKCLRLESVVIPKSTKYIGYGAFAACDVLTDVYFGGTEAQWEELLKQEKHTGLNDVTVHYNVISPPEVEIVKDGFCGTIANGYALKYTITNTGVMNVFGTGPMQADLFHSFPMWWKRKDLIKKVVIKDRAVSVGPGAFMDCNELFSVDFQTTDGCFHCVGDLGFCNCNSLVSISLPNGTTKIGNNAFMGCSKLRRIVIPASVMEIGGLAFMGCENLSDIYFGGSERQWTDLGGNEKLALDESVTIHYGN